MAPKKDNAVAPRTRLPRAAKDKNATVPEPIEIPKTTAKPIKKSTTRKLAPKPSPVAKGKQKALPKSKSTSIGANSDKIIHQEATYPNPFSTESSRNNTASLYSKLSPWSSTFPPAGFERLSPVGQRESGGKQNQSPGFNEAMGFRYSPGFGGSSGFITRANSFAESTFGAPSSPQKTQTTRKDPPTIAGPSQVPEQNQGSGNTFPPYPSAQPYTEDHMHQYFTPQGLNTSYGFPSYMNPLQDPRLGNLQYTPYGGYPLQNYPSGPNYYPQGSSFFPTIPSYNYPTLPDFGPLSSAQNYASSLNLTGNDDAPASNSSELGIKESRMTRERTMLVPGGKIAKKTITTFIPTDEEKIGNKKVEWAGSEGKVGIVVVDKEGNIENEDGEWLEGHNQIEGWEVAALLDRSRRKPQKKKNGIAKKTNGKKSNLKKATPAKKATPVIAKKGPIKATNSAKKVTKTKPGSWVAPQQLEFISAPEIPPFSMPKPTESESQAKPRANRPTKKTDTASASEKSATSKATAKTKAKTSDPKLKPRATANSKKATKASGGNKR